MLGIEDSIGQSKQWLERAYETTKEALKHIDGIGVGERRRIYNNLLFYGVACLNFEFDERDAHAVRVEVEGWLAELQALIDWRTTSDVKILDTLCQAFGHLDQKQKVQEVAGLIYGILEKREATGELDEVELEIRSNTERALSHDTNGNFERRKELDNRDRVHVSVTQTGRGGAE